MNKCKVNYWVDMITGVAFLVCAVTGLFRLFPEATVSVSAAGQPVILGVGTSVWRTVHDWSGVVMAAGVGVHTALHLRWLVAMTGRMLRGEGRQTGRRTERRAGLAQAPTTSAAAVAVARDAATVHPAEAAAPPAARRVSRRGFLAAAGVVGATAFFAGCGLLSGGGDNASPGTARGRQNRSDEIESERAGASSGSDDRSDDGSSNGGSSPNGGSTTESRVVVDATACTGCGTCAQVCPYGVFTLSNGKAVAQNPEACRLCGRCLRTCAPGAITLNA